MNLWTIGSTDRHPSIHWPTMQQSRADDACVLPSFLPSSSAFWVMGITLSTHWVNDINAPLIRCCCSRGQGRDFDPIDKLLYFIYGPFQEIVYRIKVDFLSPVTTMELVTPSYVDDMISCIVAGHSFFFLFRRGGISNKGHNHAG